MHLKNRFRDIQSDRDHFSHDSLLLLSRRSLSRGGGEPSTASCADIAPRSGVHFIRAKFHQTFCRLSVPPKRVVKFVESTSTKCLTSTCRLENSQGHFCPFDGCPLPCPPFARRRLALGGSASNSVLNGQMKRCQRRSDFASSSRRENASRLNKGMHRPETSVPPHYSSGTGSDGVCVFSRWTRFLEWARR
jgi:hypothetical protein